MNYRIHNLSMPARQMEWAGDFTMIFVPYSGAIYSRRKMKERGQ